MDMPVPSGLIRARPKTVAIGWAIHPEDREALLEHFPPAYPRVMADHVIYKTAARPREPLPGPCHARVVGEVDDDAGVQCLVVEINGSVERWDGAVFHATWSLDERARRRPIESIGVIAWLGWAPVEPVWMRLTPTRF